MVNIVSSWLTFRQL